MTRADAGAARIRWRTTVIGTASNKRMQLTKRTEAGVRARSRTRRHFMSASQLIRGVGRT